MKNYIWAALYAGLMIINIIFGIREWKRETKIRAFISLWIAGLMLICVIERILR